MDNKSASNIEPTQIKGDFASAFQSLRKAMVEEANHSCDRCRLRKRPGSLHIHHIDGCALNWTRSNLMVVCKQCHHILHGHQITLKGRHPKQWTLQDAYNAAHPRAWEGKSEKLERWRKALEEVRN